MGNIAKIAKENAPTGPMPFTGGAAYDLPKAIDSAKAFVAVLKDAGIAVDDVAADTKKIGDASYQASLQAAKLYEKMSPIEKLDFEKVLKGLGFPPEAIASIEKGTASLKQARAEAEASSWENWAPAFRKIGEAIQSAAQAAGAFFSSLAASAGAFFADFWQRLVDAVNLSVQQVKDAFTSVATTIENAFNAIMAPIQTVLTTIGGWVNALLGKAQALLGVVQGLIGGGGAPSGGGGIGHAATGGLFVGRHGGIDTNLAYLTSGEFIMNTAAVQKYGVAAMHSINSMQAPRFAMGGLNTGARPSFAGYAASAAPRVLNLSIEGRSFPGLSIPEATAASLERFSVHSQLASTGRKPSWKR
jgi:hypothetical protein